MRQKGLGELVAFEVDVEQSSVRLESHASISQWRLNIAQHWVQSSIVL